MKHQASMQIEKIEKTRDYLVDEIQQNELISKKHKKICTKLNSIKDCLVLHFAVTGCISISAFHFLLGIAIEITSFAKELIVCAITAGIKKYKSKFKKKTR